MAINQIGSALAESMGTALASESDIEFAGQAIPFSLKLTEALLLEQPDNDALLLAAASGFTQYAYVWIQQPADFIEIDDFFEAQRLRDRARAFYLRANRYALRALEVRHPGFSERFTADPAQACAALTRDDIETAYWAAASLGAAISLSKTDPELIARQPEVEALIDRAYALAPDWNDGALEEFLIAYELVRPAGLGPAHERARRHFERAVELSGGRSASAYVTFAESVSVAEQNRTEFLQLLDKALAVPLDGAPEKRLAIIAAQQRARWLLERVDELFLE